MSMKLNIVIVWVMSIVTLPVSAKIIYVDDDATGTADGTSWINAHVSLQDALTDASESLHSVDIHVGQGIYKPDQGKHQVPGDAGATFSLIDGVTLTGGYAGLGQTDPNTRDMHKFASVLHGDLQGDDGSAPEFDPRTNNSQILVTSIHNDSTAVIDGFTITGGLGWSGPGISCYDSNALFMNCTITQNKSIGREGGFGGGMYMSGGSPTLIDCLFQANWALAEGGGLWCQSSSKPTLSGCRFRGNVAATGGGMSVAESQPVITNCVFENNEALYGAGLGIHYRGDPLLENCTFYGNRGHKGGVLYIGYQSLATVKNCILWNDGPEIINGEDSTVDITFSNIQSQWPGQGNINVEPLFAAPGHSVHVLDPNIAVEPNDPNALWVSGDYHLKSQAGRWISPNSVEPNSVGESWTLDDVTSPGIDAGDPNSSLALEPLPNGGVINIGAYGNTPEASKSTRGLVAGTGQYGFMPDQATLVQTGGFAGVHWTYDLAGQFALDVDPEAGTASFLQMDARAVDTDNPDRILDLDTTLNLTGLTGTIDPTGAILFAGKAANEVTVDVQITLERGLVHVVGKTTPPPGSADFFIFTLDALALKMR
ncbi:MAG: hypothetical protein GY809_07595 [Planctomycetes bacterium]|nr:hypothetical protein [Planctomycetota bacterium]